MSYEEAVSKMPPGWRLWGHFGDGKWRAGPDYQSTSVVAKTIEDAVRQARHVAGLSDA